MSHFCAKNLYCLQLQSKRFDRARQNAVDIRNQNTIVGHRNAAVLCIGEAVFHLALIEHAGTAVDDELVRLEIIRECAAACEMIIEFFAGVLLNPARQLDRADVVTLAVMGAAFRDQDGIAFLKSIQCLDTTDCLLQTALVAREQDGE